MLHNKMTFDVNGDGTISAEYEDERYYRSFGNYTVSDIRTFIKTLETIVEDAQEQLDWYNSINEVKCK